MRFEGNGSKTWDGKEVDVPRETVVKLGEWTKEGLERAHINWAGKGKSRGKTWNCLVLPADSESEPDGEEAVSGQAEGPTTATTLRKAACGKQRLERELAELERGHTARKLTAAAEGFQ